jgi:hypothetical protein
MNLSIETMPPALLQVITKPKRKSAPQHQRLPLATPSYTAQDVMDMLRHIDPDCSYSDWIKVGMALHEGGYSLDMWNSWSAQGSKYKQGECRDKWNGFNGAGGVSMGSLVHRAREGGYQRQGIGFNPLSQPNDPKEEKPPLVWHHWSELDSLPASQYLIKGLLNMGCMSVVFGASNSGKTFFALNMACHIALGWEWQGSKTKKGKVVYVAAEGGIGIRDRLKAFELLHELDGYGDIYLIPANISLGKDDSDHERVIEKIKSVDDVKLVVIDTLARAMGAGDENNASDMGAFVKNCDAIRHNTGAHVMVIHHSGKDEARGARGHSSLKAAIDTEIQVAQKSGIITALVSKQRDGKTGQSYAYELQEFEVRKDEDGDSVASCALVQTEPESKKDRLSGQPKATYQVLTNLMCEEGEHRKPKSGMKEHRCVSVAAFKDHFIKAGITNTDKPDSLNRLFLRQKNTLKNKGFIGEWEGYIWLTDKSDKAG